LAELLALDDGQLILDTVYHSPEAFLAFGQALLILLTGMQGLL
jgi:hypothetical protein